MRTTLMVDDDVLAAARIRADECGETIGAVVSALARRGLSMEARDPIIDETFGYPQVRTEGHIGPPITLELINRLRDEGI